MRSYIRLSLFVLAFCIIGAGLEWAYGMFWSLVGTTPWIYPRSPFQYTSLEGLPLWGLGALLCASAYRAIMEGKVKYLLGTVLPLALAALWILVYARFIA